MTVLKQLTWSSAATVSFNEHRTSWLLKTHPDLGLYATNSVGQSL